MARALETSDSDPAKLAARPSDADAALTALRTVAAALDRTGWVEPSARYRASQTMTWRRANSGVVRFRFQATSGQK